MKNISIFIAFMLIFSNALFAQVAVNNDGSPPNASAGLDVKFDNKGFLPPRMTTAQRNAIASPAEGLVIYNYDEKNLNVYDGTSWEPITTFACGQPMTDPRDGKTYNTILIGSQCWMAQNLNVGAQINSAGSQTANGIIEKYCYDDDPLNCDIYGGLYQWNELMNYTSSSSSNPSLRQGICPTGWHIPSDEELCVMETYLDATMNCAIGGLQGTDIGGKLKEAGTSHWASPNTGATNSSGFTALPGGVKSFGGGFDYLNANAYFWSATESSSADALDHFLLYDNAQVARYGGDKGNGMAGRCCKNQ